MKCNIIAILTGNVRLDSYQITKLSYLHETVTKKPKNIYQSGKKTHEEIIP